MSAGAVIGDELKLDLRGISFKNILLAAVMGSAAAGMIVGGVFSATQGDETAGLVLFLVSAPFIWIATITVHARLTAGPDGIVWRMGGRTTSTSWAEIRSVYLVWSRGRPNGLMATAPDGHLVMLSRADYPSFRPFEDDDLTHAAQVLDHMATRRRAGPGDVSSTTGARPAHGLEPPRPRPHVVYRTDGWPRALRGLAFMTLWFGGWIAVSWYWQHSALFCVFLGGLYLWLVARDMVREPRPGQIQLEADEAGVAWNRPIGLALDWTQVVDILATDGKTPQLMLLDTEHRAHVLPRPRGTTPTQLAAELTSRRLAPRFGQRVD